MTPPTEHWLWRLDAAAWLEAARVELERGHTRIAERRAVVAHARRAAGMALNAVLAARMGEAADTVWGRSYLEHLQAIADGRTGPLPDEARVRATRPLAVPAIAPALVVLSGQRAADLLAMLDDAAALVELCRESVSL
jgi:hypothetical protein